MTPDVESKSLVSGALSPISRASFSGIDADVLLGDDKAPFTVMDMTVAPGTGALKRISPSMKRKSFTWPKVLFCFWLVKTE